MPLDIIVTTNRWNADPASRDIVAYLKEAQDDLAIDGAILYYDFPAYADYEASIVRPDILVYSPEHGFVAIRTYSDEIFRRSSQSISEIDIALDDFMGNLHGKLVKSRILRKSGTQTKVPIHTVIISPKNVDQSDVETSTVVFGIEGLKEFFDQIKIDRLTDEITAEVRSVVEGAKALSKPTKRPNDKDSEKPLITALNDLESQIANFDQRQRHIALVDVGGPARIRGLAGSGKTIILAMKAAHLHLNDRTAKILVTFYTKSLRTTIKSLITKFYRVYSDIDPDWNMIQIRHGWGGSKIPGVYSDACARANTVALSLPEAKAITKKRETAFEAACRDLLNKVNIKPFYDHVLIDEGQDFPSSFYKLAYAICKGERDKKSIVWAYDELQDIMNVKIREPREIFGQGPDGIDCVDLDRSSKNAPPGATNDAVLNRAYRNQRDVLVTAHALGFGVYDNIVQMLESAEHWNDVGYDVITGPLVVGETVKVRRGDGNSPTNLQNVPNFKLIDTSSHPDLRSEVSYIADEAVRFVQAGLNPEDILVISLDDRSAKAYFRKLTEELSNRGIMSNNVIADPFNEPPFTIDGKITLSTVYRAKGNEAPLVFVLGADAVDTDTRDGRNKIFTAFTRTKAWLRVSGTGLDATSLLKEVEEAEAKSPEMEFVMPDPANINLVQRGFSEKQSKALEAKKRYIESLKAAGLSDEEIDEELSGGSVIE